MDSLLEDFFLQQQMIKTTRAIITRIATMPSMIIVVLNPPREASSGLGVIGIVLIGARDLRVVVVVATTILWSSVAKFGFTDVGLCSTGSSGGSPDPWETHMIS